MKTKEISIKKEIFVCEECGKESDRESEIEACERTHLRENCSHSETSYYRFGSNILLKCKKCGYRIGRVDFGRLPNKDQKILKDLYCIIKNNEE